MFDIFLDTPIFDGSATTRRMLLRSGNLRAFRGSLYAVRDSVPYLSPDEMKRRRMEETSWAVKEWGADSVLQQD